MFCPNCLHNKLQTIDSRESSGNTTKRRKRCPNCGIKFSTIERIEIETVNFVKAGKEVK